MGSRDLARDPEAGPQISVLTRIFIHFFLQSIYQYYRLFYMDSYFIFHNISPENKNKNNINTTQGENKFTSNQHYHYLQQIMSDNTDQEN